MQSVALQIPSEHPAFAGHFPGQPLLPGVSLLAEVLETVLAEPPLAALVGPAPRIANAKFLAPVLPGAQLSIELKADLRAVRFEVHEGAQVMASGQFEVVR